MTDGLTPPNPMLDSQLHHLESVGLLHRAQAEPELEYLFRHALIQDAAYHSLLKTDRKRFHHLAAETLEKLYADRLDELSPILAYHFQHADEHEQAVNYFAQAAQRASNAFANTEAISHFQSALLLASPADARRSAFLIGLGDAQYRQGFQAQAIATYREAAQLLEAAQDYNQLAWVYTQMSRFAFYSNALDEAVAIGQEGLAILYKAGGGRWPLVPRMVDCLRASALGYYFIGNTAEAVRWAEAALELANQLEESAGKVNALLALGTVLPHRNMHRKVAALEEARALAPVANRNDLYSTSSFNLADTLMYAAGDYRTARALFIETGELLRRQSFLINELWSLSSLISVCVRLGDIETITAQLPYLRAQFAALPSPGQLAPTMQLVEAEYLHYLGQSTAALAQAQSGLAMARQIKDHQSIHFLAHLVGRILIEHEQWAEAQPVLLELWETGKSGFSWGVAIPCCLLTIAEARQGHLAKAYEWLAQARATAGDPPPPLDVRWLTFAEAEVLRAEGQREAAIAAYRAVLHIDEQMNGRWDAQQVQVRLGQLVEASPANVEAP